MSRCKTAGGDAAEQAASEPAVFAATWPTKRANSSLWRLEPPQSNKTAGQTAFLVALYRARQRSETPGGHTGLLAGLVGYTYVSVGWTAAGVVARPRGFPLQSG